MKTLLLLLLLLFSVSSVAAECPTLEDKRWLVTFEQKTEGQFSHEYPAIGRLFASGSVVLLDYAEAVNFAPTFVNEINRREFGLPIYGPYCSFELIEIVPNPLTLVGWRIIGFFKGKGKFRFIVHTGDNLEVGAGVGERTWLP